jgi:hypothetical protein
MKGGKSMAHAIIRGANGRRHEVEFDGAEVTVEVFFGEQAVEIVAEANDPLVPSDKRRFALLNVPRSLFNKALADAARRSQSRGGATKFTSGG